MRKAIALFTAVIIAMIAVGLSYAMWDKYLYIDGTVYTGEVNAVWTSAVNWDPPAPPVSLDPNPDGTRKDKDVGSTTVTGVGTQELVVTINNGYPSYFNDIQVEFANTGTIPVKIQSVTITADNFVLASAYGANDGEIWIDFVNGIGTQLEPGDDAASSFKFHVEQCAEELATYTFTVAVRLVQWNEYIP
jgi:hypothetical protein